MAIKLSIDDIKNKLPTHLSIVESTYVNTYTSAIFVDSIYGEFSAIPKKIFSGKKSHPERIKAEYVVHNKLTIDQVKSRLPVNISICESTYVDTHTKAKFVDSEYGEFWAVPREVFKGKNKKRYEAVRSVSLEEAKSRLPAHISIDESTYNGASFSCIFIDVDFGPWKSRLDRIMAGQNHPKRGHASKRISIDEVKARLSHNIKIDELTYNGTNYKARFIDSEYGEFWALVSNILYQDQAHPRRYGKISRGEEEVAEFASLLAKSIIRGYRPIKYEDSRLEIDVFLQNENIGIEYNGLHWHSDQFKDPDYHLKKRQMFESIGIKLLQFNDDEWLFKKDIVKSMIKAKLGLITEKINARDCEIRVVVNKSANQFLNNNHLMGTLSGISHVGLFRDKELVCILSYKIKKDVLKIERFASKINTIVRGGFEKLLKSIDKARVREIHNWVDLRYGTGLHLLNKGFRLEKETLGWKWTDGKNTYNRLKCRANMDSRRLTERQHAEELGWHRIYDAGQRLFINKIR